MRVRRLSLPAGGLRRWSCSTCSVLQSTVICTRAMQDIICTARPHASHDLARKNAKFAMKLSATCHATLEMCGESRQSNTITITSSIKINIQCTVFASKPPIQPVLMCSTYMYINSPNYLRHSTGGYLHQYKQQSRNCD